MDAVVVLITAPDEEAAARIGRALVTEGLAACVNIVKGVRSIYRWKGEINDDAEALMLVKTTAGGFDRLERFVRKAHPYETPEIIAIPVTDGSKPYLDWLEENTRLG